MIKYYCTFCGMWRQGCKHVKHPMLKRFFENVKCRVAAHEIVVGACMRHDRCVRCRRCGEHV